MKKLLNLLWVIPCLLFATLWLPSFFDEVATFGLFNKEYGLFSGNYPLYFWVLTITSFVAAFLAGVWIAKFVKSKINHT